MGVHISEVSEVSEVGGGRRAARAGDGRRGWRRAPACGRPRRYLVLVQVLRGMPCARVCVSVRTHSCAMQGCGCAPGTLITAKSAAGSGAAVPARPDRAA